MQSLPSGKSEILLFNPTFKQVTMENAKWVDYHPISSITSNGPIKFKIKNGDYLDLNDTALYVKYKIKRSGGNDLDTTDVCAPVNMMLSSLFSDVKLSLGGTDVEKTNSLYPYKALMTALLQYDKLAKDTHLRASGYCQDTAGQFEALGDKNEGFKTRSTWTANSQEVELMGPLFLDLFTQSKYIIPNIELSLELVRSPSTFCVLAEKKYEVEISDAVLYIRTVALNAQVQEGHMLGLKNLNAVYPIQKSEMKYHVVPSGSSSYVIDNVFHGVIPKMIAFGFVKDKIGPKDNPFNFHHFNLSSLSIYSNGVSVPFKELKTDFKNKLCMRAYLGMFQNLEMFGRNMTNSITYDDFVDGGYTLFSYNLTPDLDMNGGQPTNIGSLRIELEFAEALKESINIIFYSITDDSLQITGQGKIL